MGPGISRSVPALPRVSQGFDTLWTGFCIHGLQIRCDTPPNRHCTHRRRGRGGGAAGGSGSEY